MLKKDLPNLTSIINSEGCSFNEVRNIIFQSRYLHSGSFIIWIDIPTIKIVDLPNSFHSVVEYEATRIYISDFKHRLFRASCAVITNLVSF